MHKLFTLLICAGLLASCASFRHANRNDSLTVIDTCDVQMFWQLAQTNRTLDNAALAELFVKKTSCNCQHVIDDAFLTERNDSSFKLTVKKTFVDSLQYVNKTFRTYLVTLKNNHLNSVEIINGFGLRSENPISFAQKRKELKMLPAWSMRKK